MYFPKLTAPRQSRVTVNRFPGLDRRPRGQEGSFREMENLCAQGYPTLTVRRPRGVAGSAVSPGGLTVKEGLIWVDGHTLYINGSAAGLVLSEGRKQLISMGAWLLIWPDKAYINTKDLTDFGSLENKRVTEGEVSFALCRPDGTVYSGYLAADEAPEEPEAGSLWLDTGGDETALRQYGQDGWTEVDDVCVGLHAAGIGVGFRAGDGVSVSGCREEALNGSFQLRAAEEDCLVVTALPGGLSSQTEPVTVERSVPDMDYVVESGNRLWGCKYGIVDGQAVNAVYASKLGDFRNWNCFAGLSTDSYAASRGSDGAFTGAADYLGSPLFFKENCVERVYPSANGAHQIVTVQCPGVKDGSGGSLQVVDGKLYYHSQGGVCVFDGSMPVNVSQALGEARYHDAVAGAAEGCYYLSAADEAGAWHLLVLDTRQGLWYREDGVEALGFAPWGGDLYCLTAEGQLLAMKGAGETHEGPVQWMAETGELGLDAAESRYLVRLSLRLLPEAGSTVRAWLSYDEGGSWQPAGSLVVRLTTGRRTRFMQFKGIGQIMTMLAVGLVALMVLAGLFELLFEIGSRGDSLQSTAAWDMLHYRPAMGSGWFLGVVRVLFLTLLGALVTALRAVAVGGEETVPMVILGLGQSLAGALVMEIGSRVLFVPAGRCWLILWVLLAATPAWKPAPRTGNSAVMRGHEQPKQSSGSGGGFTFH